MWEFEISVAELSYLIENAGVTCQTAIAIIFKGSARKPYFL